MSAARHLVLTAFLLLVPVLATAHPVVVDGSPDDWFVRDATLPDQGIIARNAAGEGEFIWIDAAGDARTDLADPEVAADLLELRLTGDATGLYVLARFAGTSLVDGPVQFQLALDMDQVPLSGATFLPGFADTEVPPEAAWDKLIQVDFTAGFLEHRVWDPNFTSAVVGAAAFSEFDACLEILLPWSELGGEIFGPLAVTAAVLKGNPADGNAVDIGGPGVSDVLDAMTLYGDPGLAANTWTEVSDAVIDHHAEVWFHLDPDNEPSAPFLITEVLYDAIGAEPAEEWYEIANITGLQMPLQGWTLTDEETPDGSEGARSFPAGAVLLPAEVVWVGNNATAVANAFGSFPDWEIVDAEPAIFELDPAPLWAAGLLTLGNSGDQLLLIDPHWTIVDVVTWESGTYPGITATLGAIGGRSIARTSVADTDDGTADFEVLTLPNPGQFAVPTSVPDGDVPFAGPDFGLANHPNPFNPTTMITWDLPNSGPVSVNVYDPMGRLVRTLVDGENLPAGSHMIAWNGRDDRGQPVATGVYVVRMASGTHAAARHMVLIK